MLHDTTELPYQRTRYETIGKTCQVNVGGGKGSRHLHTVCRLLMHASLVVTAEGLPLGLAAVKIWTRRKVQWHPHAPPATSTAACGSGTRRT